MVEASSKRVTKSGQSRQDKRRIAVFVLGMHRSGTSALTRVLNIVGCDLPKNLMEASPENPVGYWESTSIYKVNNRVLESAGSVWHDWTEINPGWFDSPKADQFKEEAIATLTAEFGGSRLFVVKDPRICRVLPFWLEVMREMDVRPLVCLPIRNPLEVAASLEKRNGFDQSRGLLLWARHVLDAEFASRGLPRSFSTYDQLMVSWGQVIGDAQSRLGISFPRLSDRSAAEVEAFVSERHRNHKVSSETVATSVGLSSWISRSYAIFRKWSETGEDVADRAVLDQIRGELNVSGPAFSRLVTVGQQARDKVVQLEKAVAEKTGQIAAEKAASAEHQSNAKRLEGDLQAARTLAERTAEELKDKTARLAATQSSVGALEQKVKQLEQEIETARQGADDAKHSLADLRTKLSQTQSALAQRSLEAEQATERIAELTAELAKANASAEQLRAERDAAAQKAAADKARHEQEARAAAQAAEEARREAAALRAERDAAAQKAAAEKARHEQEALAALQRAEKAEHEAGELRTNLSMTQSALAQRSLDAEQAAERARAIAADLAKANAYLEQTRAEKSAAERQTAAERDQHEAAIRERFDEIATITQLLADTEAKLRAERAAAEERRGEDAQRAALIAKLHEEISARGAEVERLRSEKVAAEARMGEAVERSEAELTKLRQALGQNAAEVEKLRSEKVAAEARIGEADQHTEAELAKLRQALGQNAAEVERSEAALATLRQALAQNEAEVERLRAEKAAAEATSRSAIGLAEVELAGLRDILDQRAREAETLRAGLATAEKAASDTSQRLEQRIKERFQESASLTRIALEAEKKAEEQERKTAEAERLRLALAKQMSASVSALIDGQAWRLLPRRLRLRRQMVFLKRSGLFDVDWYVKEYPDIAAAGADPLRHFIQFGADEGRSPNALMAELKRLDRAATTG